MRAPKIILLPVALAFILIVGVFQLTNPACLVAEEIKIDVNNPNAIKAGLELMVGKSVTLRLRAGEDLSGVVEAVGPAAVRIGSLVGKEYFSAVVALENISALIYRNK